MNEDDIKWVVTAFLFSGRPNPQWELTAKQSAVWMNLWQQAATSSKDVERPSILGYTGCRLQYNEHSHWLIYNGCVSFYNKDSVVSKDDKYKEMEKFLLQTAPNDIKNVLRSLAVL